MVKSPAQSRQNGRYNKTKDEKSNRKNVKKELTLDQELEQISEGTFQLPEVEAKPHSQIEEERPKPKPSFHQKQLAFTPSKSHLK
jgi:hypothetical protein